VGRNSTAVRARGQSADLRRRQTCESEDRVQFDPIRSDASLPVKEVEEGDATDTRPAADPSKPPGAGHQLSPVGRRSLRADRRGSLRDHRARAAARDE